MKITKSIFLFIAVFLYVFGPVFRPIGAWMDLIFATSGILSIYGLVILRLKIPKFINLFLGLIFVFTFSLATISLYDGTSLNDYVRFLLRPIRILTTLFAGYVLAFLIIEKRNEGARFLMQLVFYAVVAHSCIMITQIISPEFKDLIYSYTAPSKHRGSYDYNFRMGGLSGGTGGAVLSVVQSLGILLIPFLFSKHSFAGKILVSLLGILIFFSILICGRSGVYAILFLFPISIYLSQKRKSIMFWFKSGMGLLAIVILFLSSFILFDKVEAKSPTYYALKRSLDTFLKYRDSGEVENRSFENLTNHFVLPSTINVWLIGESEHLINTQFNRTLQSDVGYIRNIWGWGLPISIIFWFPIIYFGIFGFRLRKRSDYAAILLIFSLVMIIFQLKENYFYVRMFFSIYSLILFGFYFEINKLKQNRLPAQSK